MKLPAWLSFASPFAAPEVKQQQIGAPASLYTEQAYDRFLTLLTQVPDPDEVLKKAGVTRTRLRLVTADDEITTACETRRLALVGTPWHLEGPESEGLKFVADQLAPWHEQVVSGALEALWYGYSVLEAVYQPLDGNRVGYAEVCEKPFEWFIPRHNGTVLYRSMLNPMGEPTLPEKMFLTAHKQTYRNPYGEALYSRLYWPWFFRANGWRFWVKWLERFGTPFLLGNTSAQTKGEVDALAAALKLAVQDSAIAVGGGATVEAVEAKSGAAHFEAFERCICSRVQKLILGQTLTTDAGGSSGKMGSQALGNVHNEVRHDRRNADVRMVAATVQRMVNVLWALNSFPGEPPIYLLKDDTGLEAERAQRDASLLATGAVKFTEAYYVRAYDYEEAEVIIPADPAPAGASGQPDAAKKANTGKGGDVKASLLFSSQFTPQQQAIEDAIDPVIAKAQLPLTREQLREVVAAATSLEDLRQRLAVLMSGRSMQDFEATLAHAIFAAELLGYAHAQEA